MRKISSLFVLLILSSSLFSTPNWDSNWRQVLKKAKIEGKRVVFVFHTEWCPHCKKLIRDTLSSPKVNSFLKSKNFFLTHVNPEKDKEAERKFKVYGYPTIIIFNEYGDEIDRILGFVNSSEFIKTINEYLKGENTLEDLIKKYKKSPEKIDILYKIGEKYMAKGEFEKAILTLDDVIKKDPYNKTGYASKALYFKGYTYYKWKKYKKAGDTMLSLTRKYPFSKELEDAYLAGAYYYEKGGFLKEAIKTYREYLSVFEEKKDEVDKEIKRLEKRLRNESKNK